MSRSGYVDADDCDEGEQWRHIRWRGAIKSAIRGKRGQAFLREMLDALDALPQKRLVPNVLQEAEWSEDGEELVPVKGGRRVRLWRGGTRSRHRDASPPGA